MPVVGSSAYNTAGQITSLVRSLLNDAQGNLFTDTVLLPYANSAYRKLQRAIGNAGGGGFIQDDALLVVTAITQADTSLQVSITDATTPPNQLPTDLLVPVKIWERPNGSTDDFLEMVDLSPLFSWRHPGHADSPALLEGLSGFHGRDVACAGAQFAGSRCLRHGGSGRLGARQPARGKVGRRRRRCHRGSHHGSGSPRAAILAPPEAILRPQRLHAVLIML